MNLFPLQSLWQNEPINVDIKYLLNEEFESNEGYEVKFSAFSEIKKEITIKAKKPLSLAFGASQLKVNLKNGFLADSLGYKSPYFSLRPLWVPQKRLLKLSNDFLIAFPSLDTIDELCLDAIEYGYNALIFGSLSKHGQNLTDENDDILLALQQVKNYGLKVILAPGFMGQEAFSINLNLRPLLDIQDSFDYILWQSLYLHPTFDQHPSCEDLTLFEIILKELKVLEIAFKNKLIYFLPTNETYINKQVSWLDQLLSESSNQTILSFSAFQGDPGSSHRPPHPYFSKLRKVVNPSFTSLLPIFQISFEGYEQIFSFLSLEKILPYLTRHSFLGVITITNSIPLKNSLLAAGLFCMAQCLWHRKTPILIFEAWQRANLPNINFHELMKVHKEAEYVLHEIQMLKDLIHLRENYPHEMLKMHVNHLVSFLNYIFSKRVMPPSFFEEVKAHLQQTAQGLAITLPSLFEEHSSILPSFLLKGKTP